jgi:hypothetical protein
VPNENGTAPTSVQTSPDGRRRRLNPVSRRHPLPLPPISPRHQLPAALRTLVSVGEPVTSFCERPIGPVRHLNSRTACRWGACCMPRTDPPSHGLGRIIDNDGGHRDSNTPRRLLRPSRFRNRGRHRILAIPDMNKRVALKSRQRPNHLHALSRAEDPMKSNDSAPLHGAESPHRPEYPNSRSSGFATRQRSGNLSPGLTASLAVVWADPSTGRPSTHTGRWTQAAACTHP